MSADGGVAGPVRLPKAASLVAGMTQAAWLSPEGEIALLPLAEAARRARAAPPFVCHARATARRLGVTPFACFDLLELFAFVRPARFCVPTPRGIAAALDLDVAGGDLAGTAQALRASVRALLGELQMQSGDGDARAIAEAMAKGGWSWAEAVLAALPPAVNAETPPPAGLAVWNRLGEWAEHAPEPPPGNIPVGEDEARLRLAELVGERAEPRPQQADYAGACAYAFAPRDDAEAPRVLLAEAGTGVGKTLGYIAPASVWAEKNAGAVWISTFTRNLQHQIASELDRLYPDPVAKARRVVVRKGRENYLCLLNFEDSLGSLAMRPQDAAAAGLVARWVAATRDGDMVGGDLPGWLPELVGRAGTVGLTDRRGECVHSACSHYHRCFIEKSVRRARRARIVVANHALVMIQAALGGLDDDNLPWRYVLDEGHHVFDAADGAFSLALTGREAAELRRWILGAEDGRRSRARGLKRRLDDLLANDTAGQQALDQAVDAARNTLPAEGWLKRIADGRAQRVCERFLALTRDQVLARTDADQGYSLETEPRPAIPGLIETARELASEIKRVEAPLKTLAQRLRGKLADEAAKLDTSVRMRIEAAVRGLERRAMLELGGWRRMLEELERDPPGEFVDWLAVERADGHAVDIGMHRHFVDPTRPFAEFVVAPAHGVLVTSATLTDGSGDTETDWLGAEARTGARHLKAPAMRARVKSPFDYPAQTRVFIVNDINRNDLDQIAAAYRELIVASGGGALGLFTAIQRLRAVHKRIAAPLEAAGHALLAQHVDAMDTATLVDIFRAEEDSSLLGTDAVRDGVDVPGRSLRLIVFDRVPWPRPDILHRARKAQFGGAAYDDAITRLRLKQAFGRLVRRSTDHGVFVLLDRAMPSRLLGAFPEGVVVARLGLKDTIAATAEFLQTTQTIARNAAGGQSSRAGI